MSMPAQASPDDRQAAATEQDLFAALETALMASGRGRRFLDDYLRRNRAADTTLILRAIDRLADTMRREPPAPADHVRHGLVDMAQSIARTRAEIAAIKPDAARAGKFGEATEELDSIARMTEEATSAILVAAEHIQAIAAIMREAGTHAEVCDLIEAKITDIITTCAFQDINGQRASKVVNVLRYLESRINNMIGIWGLDGVEPPFANDAIRQAFAGPPRGGEGLRQAEIDAMMDADAPEAAGEPAQTVAVTLEQAAFAETQEPEPIAIDNIAAHEFAASPSFDALPASPAEPSTPARRPQTPDEVLAPIDALSADEKIALFS